MVNWIIVADKAQAKIYKANSSDKKLIQVGSIFNPKARMKEADLVSDKLGSQINRSSGENVRFIGHEDKGVKRVLELHIQNITNYMKQAKNRNSYDSIIAVAEPGLIGPLVSSLEKNNLPICEKVNKQFTQITEEELSKRLFDVIDTSFALI